MIKILNKRDIELEEAKWNVEKDLLKRKQKIKEERDSIKGKKRKITTSKLLIFFLFLNCTLIEIFTGWATVRSLQLAVITGITPDFSPLLGLIGAVVGEVIGFAIYSLKALRENCRSGITYMVAEKELMNNNNSNGPTAVG